MSYYAQIEREAFSITWASQIFSDYIIRLHVTIETDHKPHAQILQSKHLDFLTPDSSVLELGKCGTISQLYMLQENNE